MSRKKKVMMIDPPSGWKYGFPKSIPEGMNTEQWLVLMGYPQSEIDSYGILTIVVLFGENK